MTTKLQRVTASEVISVFERLGFFLARQSGSHKIFKNERGRMVTVPYHAGKTLHPKVLQNILRDTDLTIESFRKLLN